MKKKTQFKIVRYFNPTSDWGFKRLFGSEFNKDLLIGFLNRIVPDEGVEDLEYLNGELLLPVFSSANIPCGDLDAGTASFGIRKSVVDVYCKCRGDKRIMVEMQNYAGRPFFERSIVYTAASIVNSYTCAISNRYKISRTIFIAITGDKVFPELDCAPVRIGLCDFDAERTTVMSDKILQIFVELPKFADKVEQLTPESSFLDRFAVAMKSMASDTMEPEDVNDDLLKRMYCAADINRLPESESDNYITSLMNEMEYQATLVDYMERGKEEGFAIGMEEGIEEGKKEGKKEGMKEGREEGMKEGREEGMKEGREEGMKEGREKGMKEGREEGMKEGREKGMKEGREKGMKEGMEKGLLQGEREGILKVARNFKAKGYQYDQIASCTGLTLEEIEGL